MVELVELSKAKPIVLEHIYCCLHLQIMIMVIKKVIATGDDDGANVDTDANLIELMKYGSYFVKNYEKTDLLKTIINGKTEYTYDSEIYSNSYLFNAYNELVADLSNFKTVDMSQTIM
jgi:hypothetical protein